jgi:hypothetical protein
MTFSLVARTNIVNASPSDADPYSVPFGKTGCALLPDGSYVVTIYSDTAPQDLIHVWKLSAAGVVLGELTWSSGGDMDGRAHAIALDGFLVQILYMTGTFEGGSTHVIDASGDTPVLLESWVDPGTANGWGYAVQHLYMRSIGVVAVCHGNGVSIYRRGRHLMSRSGPNATGWSYGIFPHPTNERKFAVWFENYAYEYTVTEDDALLVEALGVEVPTAEWMVGGGSPYAATPLVLVEYGDSTLNVATAAAPDTALWSNGDTTTGINFDAIACNIDNSLTRFAFAHEQWIDPFPYFRLRCGIVDGSTGTPTVEMLELDYGATAPDEAGEEYYVSLITGSFSIDHRDGEIVIATCIVEQGGEPDYYSVVSWKLTGGDVARLSGKDGDWRLGVNNATGRTSLNTSGGFLVEAGEGPGLDAPARPAWVKSSEGWVLLGRYVGDGEPDLPDPDPPETVDVVYHLTDINDDLAVAQALAGPTYGPSFGQSWGAFVAQGTPPTEALLVDGSDGTFTTLVQPDGVDDDVQVFTARLTPQTTVPPGAEALSAAFTIRSRATAGGDDYLDGLITTGLTTDTIRSHGSAVYNLRLAWNANASFRTSSWGLYQNQIAYPNDSGRLHGGGYAQEVPLETALGQGAELTAQWWVDHIADPDFFITVQSASTNMAHGNLQIAEITMTIRYLVL